MFINLLRDKFAMDGKIPFGRMFFREKKLPHFEKSAGLFFWVDV